jgi:hypothetical protein
MRFADVDGQKIRVIFVVVVDLNDVANLATKRRSSKTAEDEHQRFSGNAFANVEMIGTVQRSEARIRSSVAHFEVTAMHVRQRVANHVQRVFGAARHHAQSDKRKDGESAESDCDPHKDSFHETIFLAQFAATKSA